MYKIYIDTTERYDKSIKLVEITSNQKKLLEEIKGNIDIISTLNRILKNHNLKITDIDEVIPNEGPGGGSFTGIKIGVTIANILNWGLGKSNIKNLYKPNYGAEPNIQR